MKKSTARTIKLTTFADMIQKDLIIIRYSNQNNRYSCYFENAEIKDDNILLAEFGNGDSPLGAMRNYAKQIRGKQLVFNAHNNDRMVIRVPKSLYMDNAKA